MKKINNKKYTKLSIYSSNLKDSLKERGIITIISCLTVLLLLTYYNGMGEFYIVLIVLVLSLIVIFLGKLIPVTPKNYRSFLETEKSELLNKMNDANAVLLFFEENYKKSLESSKKSFEIETEFTASSLEYLDSLQKINKIFQWASEEVDPEQYLVLENEINSIHKEKEDLINGFVEHSSNNENFLHKSKTRIALLRQNIQKIKEEINQINNILSLAEI